MDPVIINESGLSADEIRQLKQMGFEVAQGSEEWHEQRLGKATASNASKVMTRIYKTKLNPEGKPSAYYYDYMRELVVERLTGNRKRFSTKHTDWGKTHESEAAERYAELTGSIVDVASFVEHPTLAAGASPDGLIGDDGLLEIKCPGTMKHIEYLETGPPEIYQWQMYWQMWITGRSWVDFMTYDPDMPENVQASIERWHRLETIMAQIEQETITFLGEVDRLETKLRNYGMEAPNGGE